MLGQDLDGDGAVQARITRPIDLAHAPGTQWAENLVRTKSDAGGEGHTLNLVGRPRSGTALLCWPDGLRHHRRPPPDTDLRIRYEPALIGFESTCARALPERREGSHALEHIGGPDLG